MFDFILPSNPSSFVILFLTLLVLGFVARAVNHLYFHPLANFPGPQLWAISRLPYVVSMVKGNFVHDVRRIHEKYGDAVRLAPNEVSFAAPNAWHDVFDQRPEHLTFPKNPLYYVLPNGKPDPGLATTTNIANHARMRKLMENAFTYKALKSQEAIIQSYVTLLMTRFQEIALSEGPKGGVANVSDWFSFTTFDIVGDLGFGESFDCLENSKYHPWVAIVFDYVQAMIITTMVRYYPTFEVISRKLIPKSLLKKQEDHYQFALEKIHRRMNLETQRPDFVTPLIEDNKDFQEMSMEEIEATLNIVIFAGSDTTATALAGTTNHLIQPRNSHVLQKLVSEIREKFANEEDITMTSTKDLPYLNAVVSEGMRMCSPTPGGMPRMAPPRGGTVCGRWLPPNTHVSVSSYTLHFSPTHFSDPESFIPDRWLPPPSRPAEITNHNPAAIQPFGFGPRRCIGRELAWAEMLLVVARLVWNFDISIADPAQPLDWRKLKTFIVVRREPVGVRLKVRGERVKGVVEKI